MTPQCGVRSATDRPEDGIFALSMAIGIDTIRYSEN